MRRDTTCTILVLCVTRAGDDVGAVEDDSADEEDKAGPEISWWEPEGPVAQAGESVDVATSPDDERRLESRSCPSCAATATSWACSGRPATQATPSCVPGSTT